MRKRCQKYSQKPLGTDPVLYGAFLDGRISLRKEIEGEKMEWEEYKETTKVLLAFYDLSDQGKESILLMLDGLKYRKENDKRTV